MHPETPKLLDDISEHRQIIAFRNVLIHGYDLVDHEQVWQVVTRDLPVLEQEVNALMTNGDSE